MTLLNEVECPWDVDPEACQIKDLDKESETFKAAVLTASSIMARLSAFTIGTCEKEVRPLGPDSGCTPTRCGGADAIRLKGPFAIQVWNVTRVRLGATEYALNTWRYDRQSSTLYRVPPDRWPSRDERWSDAGEGEAFVVDAVIGTPPDSWALDVAARLTKEIYLSCAGQKCRLPSNTTNVTSQGITIRLRDEEVLSMIPELGAWRMAVNPHNARLPGALYSADLTAARTGTLSGPGAWGG